MISKLENDPVAFLSYDEMDRYRYRSCVLPLLSDPSRSRQSNSDPVVEEEDAGPSLVLSSVIYT